MEKSLQLEMPKKRGHWRKKIGREYFIIKRKMHLLRNRRSYAKTKMVLPFWHELFEHKSFLLRPLRSVDMELQYNKVTNLSIAISHINDIVIKPGEVFSIWNLVGKPTKSKGYLEGLVLENGKISRGIGGGLCQLGNLLYWMALHTPLTITERWRHGYDVFPDINRTIPFGCGATLAYNYLDLQLKNETTQYFKISLWLSDTHLHGRFFSNQPKSVHYEIIERGHIIQQQFWGGYSRHNQIWRKTFDLCDHHLSEELIAENHAIMMYQPFLPETTTSDEKKMCYR